MSLTSSLQRIVQAKADIKTSIENKGVTVPSNTSIVDYPDYIDAITTGGGGGITVSIPTVNNLTYSLGTLSWDAPSDLSGLDDLATYNPTISYLVCVNATQLTTDNTSISIVNYLQLGTNTIKVYTLVTLTNDEYTQIIYSNASIATLTSTLLRENMGVGVVGTDIYLLGGRPTNGATPVDTIYKFDSTTETITLLSGINTNGIIAECGSATIGSKIYIIGGYSGSAYVSDIRIFDTETNNSASLLSQIMPRVNGLMGVGVVGTDIYTFGGYSPGVSNSVHNSIYKFDSTTETITTLRITMPTRLDRMGVGTVGTNCYIFGGYNSISFQNSIYKFDSTLGTISTLNTTMPTVIDAMGVGVVGTDIYIFGGRSSGSSYLNTIYKFDTNTETITLLTPVLSQGTAYMGVGVVGTNIYIFGGRPNRDNIYKFYA